MNYMDEAIRKVSKPDPSEATSRARALLDRLGESRWHLDHDWRRDGSYEVLDGDDKTVCFLATGLNNYRHYARLEFIAAAPELVSALLQRVETLETALRMLLPYVEEAAEQDCINWYAVNADEGAKARAALAGEEEQP